MWHCRRSQGLSARWRRIPSTPGSEIKTAGWATTWSRRATNWFVGWLSYQLVISRHRAEVLKNLSKGVGRHLHHPGKGLINGNGRKKSRENNHRQHARHQRLRTQVLASDENRVSVRCDSASEQDRPYYSRYESYRSGEPSASHMRDRVELTQNFGDQGRIPSRRRLKR